MRLFIMVLLATVASDLFAVAAWVAMGGSHELWDAAFCAAAVSYVTGFIAGTFIE